MIYAVGYDEEHRYLEVVFFRGVYRYFDVPRSVYRKLLASDSQGSFMRSEVIGFYQERQLSGGDV